MQHDRTRSSDPARLALKRCSACAEVKRAEGFYESRGRLSSYCKDCQRRASQLAYRRRRQDPDEYRRLLEAEQRRRLQVVEAGSGGGPDAA
jgi:ribosomal protein L20